VVTGPLDPLFDRKDDFTILQGINTTNPNPMNGSVWMLRAGARPDVWSDFSVEAAQTKTRIHSFADDQGWFEHKFADAGAWGPKDGVYGFKKDGWPSGEALPAAARIVAFPGWRDPGKFERLTGFGPTGDDRPGQGLPVHSGRPERLQAQPVQPNRRKDRSRRAGASSATTSA
jgi:hypothetical protein